jgi:tRNA A-37 threonylcarbamoyl transferase component Bud32
MNGNSCSGVRISPQERIDQLCDDFEVRWLKGQRPRIGDFVDGLSADEQPVLFYELMLVDIEYRHKAGESPSRQDYLREYSRFADKIAAVYIQFGEAAFATIGSRKDDTIQRGGQAPGSRVGHFELREWLGVGAMGDVWKAWDPRLQRLVAVKLPRAEQLSEAETLRFLREGRAAAQLRHPNLAAVYEVDRAGDKPYIASEYVEGENLSDYCEHFKLTATTEATKSVNCRLTFYAIANLCAEVAEAVHHAHEQGVVHRDLKPANIIIDRANRPHVIDFGLAKWSTDDRALTLHGELLGTPAYMSPEQALGQSNRIDRRTDVYSLGVILYELLAGQCPFIGEIGSIIHQIVSVEPRPVRRLNIKVPRDLETICIKALEKNPNRRYGTMQEMAVDLRRFVRGQPILARRAGPLERSLQWVRSHPAVAAALVAMVLVVTTSGAIVHSFAAKNYRLQGYRPVRIETIAPGARVAIVRLNDATGEPNSDGTGIIRPRDLTPLNVLLKPGNYLIEAVLAGENKAVAFAETYRTIPAAGRTTDEMRRENRENGRDEDTFYFSLDIYPTTEATKRMLAVPIAESLRRENPLLPKLLYVDPAETKPKIPRRATKRYLSFTAAVFQAQQCGNRLASAAEYEAIQAAALNNEIFDPATGKPAQIVDLFGGVAEWTTTKYQLVAAGRTEFVTPVQDSRVLAGYGDPDKLPGLMRTKDNKLIASTKFYSASIGFRGVRSGAPRFVKP